MPYIASITEDGLTHFGINKRYTFCGKEFKEMPKDNKITCEDCLIGIKEATSYFYCLKRLGQITALEATTLFDMKKIGEKENKVNLRDIMYVKIPELMKEYEEKGIKILGKWDIIDWAERVHKIKHGTVEEALRSLVNSRRLMAIKGRDLGFFGNESRKTFYAIYEDSIGAKIESKKNMTDWQEVYKIEKQIREMLKMYYQFPSGNIELEEKDTKGVNN